MVKNIAAEHGAENLIVVFGINQLSSLQVMTRTFTKGDPSFAGPLAGIALGLSCHHIFELKEMIPPEVWNSEMAMYELEIGEEEKKSITQALNEVR